MKTRIGTVEKVPNFLRGGGVEESVYNSKPPIGSPIPFANTTKNLPSGQARV